MSTIGTITVWLGLARNGDKQAPNQIMDRVERELKRIARALIFTHASRRSDYDSTALVNAAFARLLQQKRLYGENRRHFFYLLKLVMRDILIEERRQRKPNVDVDADIQDLLADSTSITKTKLDLVTDVNAALDALELQDPNAAEVAILKIYCGLTYSEIAELTNRTFAIVRDDWEYAKAWLYDRLSGHNGKYS